MKWWAESPGTCVSGVTGSNGALQEHHLRGSGKEPKACWPICVMLQAYEPSVNKCSHFLWSMLTSAGIQVHFLHFRTVSVSMLIWLQRKQKCIFPNMDYSKSIIGALGHLTKLFHIIFIGGTTPWGQWQYTNHYQDGKSLFAVQASEKTKFEGRSKRTVSTVGLAMVLP